MEAKKPTVSNKIKVMIKEVVLESIKCPKEPSASGKTKKNTDWFRWDCGVKIIDTWYNASFFNKKDVDLLSSYQNGQKVILDFYKEEYTDKEDNLKSVWKFKMPDKFDIIIWKLDRIDRALMVDQVLSEQEKK